MLINIFMKLVCKIPFKLSIILSSFFGEVAYLCDRRHTKVALNNLEYTSFCKYINNGNIFKKKIIKKVYKNLCQSIFEISWLVNINSEKLDNLIFVYGYSNLFKAYTKNRGILLISGHIGAWELLPYIVSKLGIKLNIVYRPIDFEPLNIYVKKVRSKFGGNLIPTKYAMSKIDVAINKKEAVGLLIDQSADWYNGIWVKFFGRRTCTSKGAAFISINYKIPVIPVFIFRERNKLKVVFEEEIVLKNSGDKIKDIELNTSKYAEIIEKWIYKYPEQWFWVHRRWKNKAYSFWPKI